MLRMLLRCGELRFWSVPAFLYGLEAKPETTTLYNKREHEHHLQPCRFQQNLKDTGQVVPLVLSELDKL